MEAEADWAHLRTPETYLGYGRGERFASPGGAAFDERRDLRAPRAPALDQWALAGEWTIGRENVVLERAGGSIAYRFHARDAHLVLLPRGARADPLPRAPRRRGPGRGHTASTSTRTGTASLRDGRLYQLVRERDAVRERTLEITFLEPGAEAYAFTFG